MIGYVYFSHSYPTVQANQANPVATMPETRVGVNQPTGFVAAILSLPPEVSSKPYRLAANIFEPTRIEWRSAPVELADLGQGGGDGPQARVALSGGRQLARHRDGFRVRSGVRLIAAKLRSAWFVQVKR